MLCSRSYLTVLGALLISRALAQNDSCTAMQPSNYTTPFYGFDQPFLPYLVVNGTESFDDSDTSGVITYEGNWSAVTDGGAVNSTLHVTNDTSASVSFTFTGTAIEWFGTTGTSHGIAKVTLDSTPPVEVQVDGSSTETYEQQRLWSKLELPLRKYKLTITNTNGGGAGHRLDVDAFVVTTGPTFVAPGGRVSNADGWGLIQKGSTGIAAMQLTIVSPTQLIIFDKTEHNYASIDGHPAWSVMYDINTHEVTSLPLDSNSFCASGSFLSNGTLISVGGNRPAVNGSSENAYHDVDGRQSLRVVEPCAEPNGKCILQDFVNFFEVIRWYPTTLRISDGSALIIGGNVENVFMNNATINQPSVSFYPSSPSSPASFDLPFLKRTLNANLFPHSFSLSNQRAFIVSNTESIMFNWGVTPPVEEASYPLPNGVRVTYPMAGAAMLLPLSKADNYTSRIIVCGGSDAFDMLCNFQYSAHYPASSQCSRIEITRDGKTDGWKVDDSMPDGARVMPDSVLLPTGEVIIMNGARAGYMGFGSVFDPVGLSNAADPALSPIVYSPEAEPGKRFTTLKVHSDIPRLYHSTMILTPNGNVMITGSNPNPDRSLAMFPADYRVEWLNPPYMSADRPSYKGLAATVGYGTQFKLKVDIPGSLDKSKIKVSLMDLGFSTHSMHANTRLVWLDATLSGKELTVTAPPDAGVYPPGPAYLFVIVDGVASKATNTLIGDGKAPAPH